MQKNKTAFSACVNSRKIIFRGESCRSAGDDAAVFLHIPLGRMIKGRDLHLFRKYDTMNRLGGIIG